MVMVTLYDDDDDIGDGVMLELTVEDERVVLDDEVTVCTVSMVTQVIDKELCLTS